MNSHFKYKLHIHNQNIELLYDDVNTVDKNIRSVREVRVLVENSQFIMMFDERFNELDFIYNDRPNDPFSYVNQSTEYLKEKFKELKSKDFRYKSGDGYEGSKILYLEDFITYLKSENRETIINNILE
jgi:site-specific DNA-adenine methylase